MQFRVVHSTSYTFSKRVFLEPHVLRLIPKTMPHLSLDQFNLQIGPTPAGVRYQLDPEGNQVAVCWFNGKHHSLEIRVKALVTVKDFDPFDFIVYPLSANKLPPGYSEELLELLGPNLKFSDFKSDLIHYAESSTEATDIDPSSFLLNLTKRIHADFTRELRLTGAPHPADYTFEQRQGSCRDLTWMQIQLLRRLRFATRFVSGYYVAPVAPDEFELHAWLEVFLPGAGWIGFDPSNGLLTGTHHIPLAASAQPENTMPVTGTIRGDAASDLTTTLNIKVV